MTILDLLHRYFIVDGFLVILIVFIELYIVKNHIQKFPRELIPILGVISGATLVTLSMPLLHMDMTLDSRVLLGASFGSAAVGLYQVWKQTKYFAKRLYYLNPKNDRRNNKSRDNLNIK